MKYTEYKQN